LWYNTEIKEIPKGKKKEKIMLQAIMSNIVPRIPANCQERINIEDREFLIFRNPLNGLWTIVESYDYGIPLISSGYRSDAIEQLVIEVTKLNLTLKF
jgi:hypothetical protein